MAVFSSTSVKCKRTEEDCHFNQKGPNYTQPPHNFLATKHLVVMSPNESDGIKCIDQ